MGEAKRRGGAPRPRLFKLQRAIKSSEPIDSVLVYDKDRKYTGEIMMTPDLEKAFGLEVKIYCMGLYNYDTKTITLFEGLHPYPGW